MRMVVIPTFSNKDKCVSFENLTVDIDFAILSKRENIVHNGLFIIDCEEEVIEELKDLIFPYYVMFQDF